MREQLPLKDNPEEKSRRNRRLNWFLVINLSISLLFVGLYASARWEIYQARLEYEAIQLRFRTAEAAVRDDTPVSRNTTIPIDNGDGPNQDDWVPREIRDDFLPLLEINEDVIGWITVPGTVIDYPVVQGEDNNYYLDHTFSREPAAAGAIFMDFRNDWRERNNNHLIIYGHNMRNGSMFSALNQYVRAGTRDTYMTNHNIIELNNLYEDSTWEIFSAYMVDLDQEEYYLFPNYSPENMDRFIAMAQRRSIVKTDIEVSPDDQLLSLVTCWSQLNDARSIIHARRIN